MWCPGLHCVTQIDEDVFPTIDDLKSPSLLILRVFKYHAHPQRISKGQLSQWRSMRSSQWRHCKLFHAREWTWRGRSWLSICCVAFRCVPLFPNITLGRRGQIEKKKGKNKRKTFPLRQQQLPFFLILSVCVLPWRRRQSTSARSSAQDNLTFSRSAFVIASASSFARLTVQIIVYFQLTCSEMSWNLDG